MAAAGLGFKQSYWGVGRYNVEGAEGVLKVTGSVLEVAARLAGERGTEGGPGGKDCHAREAVLERAKGVNILARFEREAGAGVEAQRGAIKGEF